MGTLRSRLGYLSFSDILLRITEGKLDAYDLVFCKDTNEFYIISPELQPCPIRSKVYIFESVLDANTKLNEATDTYVGQIVSVLIGEEYRAYIVNQKATTGRYYIAPINTFTGEIDYNTLGNRPITNMVGTLDSPIDISKLPTGIYQISGQYIISEYDSTIYLSAKSNLFIVDTESDNIKIKKITSTEIIDYVVTPEAMTSNIVVTSEYLKSQGYVTQEYVDERISALEAIIKEDTIEYVKNNIMEEIDVIVDEKIEVAFDEKLDTVLDEKIDQKIDEKISSTATDDITSLFLVRES